MVHVWVLTEYTECIDYTPRCVCVCVSCLCSFPHNPSPANRTKLCRKWLAWVMFWFGYFYFYPFGNFIHYIFFITFFPSLHFLPSPPASIPTHPTSCSFSLVSSLDNIDNDFSHLVVCTHLLALWTVASNGEASSWAPAWLLHVLCQKYAVSPCNMALL